MNRARTRIFHASESGPKLSGAAGGARYLKELERIALEDSALLAKARGLLSALLPYAGESYDSMTNVRAKHCLRTAEKVSAFLCGK